jgi:CHAD domain-containing protein
MAIRLVRGGGLLSERADDGAHKLALGYLDEASAGAARLGDPNDAEALHDFRVGIRRLRSVLRAYEPHVRRSAGKKWRRRLRSIAHLTSPGRDAEVQVEWLNTNIAAMRRHKRGARALLRRVEDTMSDAYAEVREDVLREFGEAEGKLRQRLRLLPTLEERAPVASFGEFTGKLLRRQLRELFELTSQISSPHDELFIHDARIAAKRMRYVLEPIQNEIEGGKRLVKTLKRLQDVLGDLHDIEVIEAELERERRRALGPVLRASAIESIDELARRADEQKRSLFCAFDDQWHKGGGVEFFEAIRALSDKLMGRDGDAAGEERCFRLESLPPELHDEQALVLTYGWLPSSTFEDRLCSVRSAEHTTYWRRLRIEGDGLQAEAEEELDEGVFNDLFALTAGNRVSLRRYPVAEVPRSCVVEMVGDLVVARVIGYGAKEEISWTDWLAPYIKEELAFDFESKLQGYAA